MRTIHSDFFDYLDEVWKSDLINHHKDDFWFDADDESIVEQLLQNKRNALHPSTINLFQFFNWFFKDGHGLFIEYVNQEASKTIKFVDYLNGLFEFHEAKVKSFLRTQVSDCFDVSQAIGAYLWKENDKPEKTNNYTQSHEIGIDFSFSCPYLD